MRQSDFDPISLEIFKHLLASVAEEMGITLGRTGYSPNIKERLDYSCAVFLGDGRLLAQAAHIPVHLGAMPASVRSAIEHVAPLLPGDVIILNDPYLGGTHLPDITLVSPVFIDQELVFFVASRAHHADVGGMSPGSMPLSTELYQEGIVIPPIKLVEQGEVNQGVLDLIVRNSRTPQERLGDITAQRASHQVGEQRLLDIVQQYGIKTTLDHAEQLIAYARRLTQATIESIPDGAYGFQDHLDHDGITTEPVPIRVSLTISGNSLVADFSDSSPAVKGSVNAVEAIVYSALSYVIRCIAGESLPMNHGVFEPITVITRQNSVLNPNPPHAVAGGNVETSMRIVDVIYGALANAIPEIIPAASQGTMNNLTFGGIDSETGKQFAYYETMGGGSGANAHHDGADALHCHMSNTLNTPVEALEYELPIRVVQYAVRHESGGKGKHTGGNGLSREIQFLSPVQATLLTERRNFSPYGLAGGEAGKIGENVYMPFAGTIEVLPGKVSLSLGKNDRLQINTPGGGGWGTIS